MLEHTYNPKMFLKELQIRGEEKKKQEEKTQIEEKKLDLNLDTIATSSNSGRSSSNQPDNIIVS